MRLVGPALTLALIAGCSDDTVLFRAVFYVQDPGSIASVTVNDEVVPANFDNFEYLERVDIGTLLDVSALTRDGLDLTGQLVAGNSCLNACEAEGACPGYGDLLQHIVSVVLRPSEVYYDGAFECDYENATVQGGP